MCIEEMTAQDIEKLRENRRKAKLSQLPNASKKQDLIYAELNGNRRNI